MLNPEATGLSSTRIDLPTWLTLTIVTNLRIVAGRLSPAAGVQASAWRV
jgi:hypothetical protein